MEDLELVNARRDAQIQTENEVQRKATFNNRRSRQVARQVKTAFEIAIAVIQTVFRRPNEGRFTSRITFPNRNRIVQTHTHRKR